MTFKTSIALAACAFSVFLMTAGTSQADVMTLKADLKASSETPPNSSKGTGTLTGTYDTATKTMTYTVNYADLTGPATMAHFHAPAPVGKAAGVEIPIKGDVASPIKGSVTLTPDQAKNLTEGMTYFNIHTAANKAGEIRGQVAAAK